MSQISKSSSLLLQKYKILSKKKIVIENACFKTDVLMTDSKIVARHNTIFIHYLAGGGLFLMQRHLLTRNMWRGQRPV